MLQKIIDFQILIGLFITNIVFSVVIFLLKGNIKETLYSLPLPLPTIPITILVAIITVLSIPVFLHDKKIRELRIRYICGATWWESYKWICYIYSLHIIIAVLPYIIGFLFLKKTTIIYLMGICLVELIYGYFYMFTKIMILNKGGYQKWKSID